LTYLLLKRAGHGSAKACEIILDASRGDQWALFWIKMLRRIERLRESCIDCGRRRHKRYRRCRDCMTWTWSLVSRKGLFKRQEREC